MIYLKKQSWNAFYLGSIYACLNYGNNLSNEYSEDITSLDVDYFFSQRSESENGSIELRDESLTWPYEEKFGTRFRVLFENIKFRLQAPLDSGDGPLSQVGTLIIFSWVCLPFI